MHVVSHDMYVTIYLYLCKGPRSVGAHLGTGGTLTKTTICYTFATLACGPPPLGRPWGRSGLPELLKGSFGMPKSPQSGPNTEHFMFSREAFTELWTKISVVTPVAGLVPTGLYFRAQSRYPKIRLRLRQRKRASSWGQSHQHEIFSF